MTETAEMVTLRITVSQTRFDYKRDRYIKLA